MADQRAPDLLAGIHPPRVDGALAPGGDDDGHAVHVDAGDGRDRVRMRSERRADRFARREVPGARQLVAAGHGHTATAQRRRDDRLRLAGALATRAGTAVGRRHRLRRPDPADHLWLVLSLRGGQIAEVTSFLGREQFPAFGLPDSLR